MSQWISAFLRLLCQILILFKCLLIMYFEILLGSLLVLLKTRDYTQMIVVCSPLLLEDKCDYSLLREILDI